MIGYADELRGFGLAALWIIYWEMERELARFSFEWRPTVSFPYPRRP